MYETVINQLASQYHSREVEIAIYNFPDIDAVTGTSL